MYKLPQMADMAMDKEEREQDAMPLSVPSRIYPWGLSLSLTEKELEKLDVDYEDWSVGDMFHLFAFAKITSISRNETDQGECCRVEMQIEQLAGASEDAENEDYEVRKPMRARSPYK